MMKAVTQKSSIWSLPGRWIGSVDRFRARANGVKLGRRRVKPSVEAQILALRDRGHGILRIGRQLGIGTSVVQRVFRETPWKRQSA